MGMRGSDHAVPVEQEISPVLVVDGKGRLVANPLRWPALAVYVYSKTMTTTLHFLRSRNNRHKEWSRDESSRHA
jgi:hypothetical protein